MYRRAYSKRQTSPCTESQTSHPIHVPFDPPPLNRRIYSGLKSCVQGLVDVVVYCLIKLKAPLFFAVILTLFLIVADENSFGWFFTTDPGLSWTTTTFLTWLVICTMAVYAFLGLGAVLALLF